MLRIAFDAKRLFKNFSGLGNYSRTLVSDLATQFPDHAYYLYSPSLQKNAQTKPFINNPSFKIRTTRFMPAAYWRSSGIKSQLKKDQVQIYHGLSHEIPFGLRSTKIKSVVTIHDLIFRHFPNQYSFFDRKIYDYKFKYACQHANKIIAISENTKQDIIRFYNVPKEKIKVIYQNCDPVFGIKTSESQLKKTLEKYQLPKNYLIYVGAISPRKNLLNVVKAIAALPKSLQISLVIVGKGGNYKKEVEKFIHQNRLETLTHFLGHVDQDDLPTLYQGASIFLYPSFYEGFGIPLMEALYSKTPIITSMVSALPEAAGPDAYYVDPNQPEEIAKGIEKILTDQVYRSNMIEKGFEYVQRFNNEDSTKEVMALYQEVIPY